MRGVDIDNYPALSIPIDVPPSPPRLPDASRGRASACETEDAPVCRICLSGEEERAALGELTAPCQCTGSLRYVHDRCLETWTKSAPGDISPGRGAYLPDWSGPYLAGLRVRCELCQAHYRPRHLRRRIAFRVVHLTCLSLATLLMLMIPLRSARRLLDRDYFAVTPAVGVSMGQANFAGAVDSEDYSELFYDGPVKDLEALGSHEGYHCVTTHVQKDGNTYWYRYCFNRADLLPHERDRQSEWTGDEAQPPA